MRWLFDPNGSHGLGDYPIKKLLEAAYIAFINNNSNKSAYINAQSNDDFFKTPKNIFSENGKKILTELMPFDKIHISDVTVQRELVIAKQRRADIVIDFSILNNDSTSQEETKMRIVIENKVNSTEGSRINSKSQTELYADEFLDERNSYNCVMLLYLAPTNETKCKSHEFLHIKYQTILDYVLEPIKERKKNPTADYLIDDYIRCLGKTIAGTYDENTKSSKSSLSAKRCLTVMAFSSYEKCLVKQMWDNNRSKETMLEIFGNISYFSELDSFYNALASTLRWLIEAKIIAAPKNEIEIINNTISYTKATATFAFNGKIYSKGDRKNKATIGYLMRGIIKEYCTKHPDVKFDNIKKCIVNHRASVNNWLREILLPVTEFNSLKYCDVNTYKNCNQKKCKYKNNLTKDTSCCSNQAEHSFFTKDADDVITAKGNGGEEIEFFSARYYCIDDVECIAKDLGYKIKSNNGITQIE